MNQETQTWLSRNLFVVTNLTVAEAPSYSDLENRDDFEAEAEKLYFAVKFVPINPENRASNWFSDLYLIQNPALMSYQASKFSSSVTRMKPKFVERLPGKLSTEEILKSKGGSTMGIISWS